MTELANALQDPDNDWKVKQPPPCKGCGGVHGSVNARILCLETALDRARTAADSATAKVIELAPDAALGVSYRHLQEEIRSMVHPQDRVVPAELRTNRDFPYNRPGGEPLR